MIIFSKDSLRASVESASHGRRTVLYNDKGHPSYMTVIPKFSCQDVVPGGALGTGVFPAFVVNGVEKTELLIGQFQASVIDGRAVSIEGVDPTTSVNLDQARGYCTANGVGWHLMTAWEWAAVTFAAMAASTEPRGNTSYGRSHSHVHEVGRRQDRVAPGTASGTARTLTGSGPASWRHDGTVDGIADLVGNIWEWNDGLKLVDGRIVCPNDNHFTAAESAWVAQNGYFDSPSAGDGAGASNLGAPKLASAVTNYAGPQGGNESFDFNQVSAWSDLESAVGYTAPEILKRLLIAPAGVEPIGQLYVRNYGERLPVRGGGWSSAGGAGLGHLYLNYARVYAGSGFVGFRPAFVV